MIAEELQKSQKKGNELARLDPSGHLKVFNQTLSIFIFDKTVWIRLHKKPATTYEMPKYHTKLE